ncbi:MAG: hypothetical protein HY671_05765 [Chloroflexi bacterium]|nr:hypothetical protein [Chloroflexota bacterium]
MVKRKTTSVDKVRQSFPEVCKWYMPEAAGQRSQAEIEAEVVKRSKRFKEQGISPCEQCPLCAGERHS